MIQNSGGRLIANELVIFPIITFIDRSGFHGLGTGFFINERGGFLTAKHVFMEPLNTGERIVRELIYLYAHPEADIAHGMLGRVVNNNGEFRAPPPVETLAITLDAINVNDPVSTYGYPIQDVEDPHMAMVAMTFHGIYSEGRILQYSCEGSLRTRNACYETTLVTQSGHSGGPVIKNNAVIGVNSSSFEGDTPSYFTPLNPFILDLQARDGNGAAPTFREIFARQQGQP